MEGRGGSRRLDYRWEIRAVEGVRGRARRYRQASCVGRRMGASAQRWMVGQERYRRRHVHPYKVRLVVPYAASGQVPVEEPGYSVFTQFLMIPLRYPSSRS